MTEEYETSSSFHCLTFHNSQKTGSTLSDFTTIAAHSVPAVQPTHASPTDLQEQGVFLFMCWTFLPSTILCNPFFISWFWVHLQNIKAEFAFAAYFPVQLMQTQHEASKRKNKLKHCWSGPLTTKPEQNFIRTLLDRYQIRVHAAAGFVFDRLQFAKCRVKKTQCQWVQQLQSFRRKTADCFGFQASNAILL